MLNIKRITIILLLELSLLLTPAFFLGSYSKRGLLFPQTGLLALERRSDVMSWPILYADAKWLKWLIYELFYLKTKDTCICYNIANNIILKQRIICYNKTKVNHHISSSSTNKKTYISYVSAACDKTVIKTSPTKSMSLCIMHYSKF